MAWYMVLIAVVALMRLVELAWSARNARRLRNRGGVESGAGHYPWMVALHTGFLVAVPFEVTIAARPFVPALGVPMLALVLATTVLRWWVITTLGERWCTRVIVPPGAGLITTGPYRLVRHPNYVAVAIELPALALVHSAWATALLFGTLNILLLRTRIRVENAVLAGGAGGTCVAGTGVVTHGGAR
jgi:methyltransferase